MSFARLRDLPPELQREVYQRMDGSSLLQASAADTTSRKEVHEIYIRGMTEQREVARAYEASQSQEPFSPRRADITVSSSQQMEVRTPPLMGKRAISDVGGSRRPPDQQVQRAVRQKVNLFGVQPNPQFRNGPEQSYLLARGASLTRKTRAMFGGPRFLDSATDDGAISHLHPYAQGRMADARWNCKAIGLFPFVRAVFGGERFLEELNPELPDGVKVADMERWLEDHAEAAAQVETIEVVNLRKQHLIGIRSHFYEIGGKVYNLVPKSIGRFFTGLKKLSLCNNVLTDLPDSFRRLPLRDLNLSGNVFSAVPAALAQMRMLRKLSLSANRNELALPEDSPLWKIFPLQELDLSVNNLTSIPRCIRKLANLRSLDLCENHLTAIPSAMVALKQLGTLNLSRNRFISIPSFLSQMPALTNICLQGNELADPGELIELLEQSAGKDRMEITFNHSFLPDEAVAALRAKVEDTHTVTLYPGMADRIVLEKKIEATQVVDYFEDEL